MCRLCSVSYEVDKQKMPADLRTGIESRIVLRPDDEVKAQAAEKGCCLSLDCRVILPD
jgi:hypothetical protein